MKTSFKTTIVVLGCVVAAVCVTILAERGTTRSQETIFEESATPRTDALPLN